MAQLRGAPIFVRNGHRRPQDGLFDARQSPPSRKPRRGSIARLRQNLRKPHIADALSFQNSTRQYAHAREAGIHTGIHEFDGRNTPHPKISARVHRGVGYQAGYH